MHVLLEVWAIISTAFMVVVVGAWICREADQVRRAWADLEWNVSKLKEHQKEHESELTRVTLRVNKLESTVSQLNIKVDAASLK